MRGAGGAPVVIRGGVGGGRRCGVFGVSSRALRLGRGLRGGFGRPAGAGRAGGAGAAFAPTTAVTASTTPSGPRERRSGKDPGARPGPGGPARPRVPPRGRRSFTNAQVSSRTRGREMRVRLETYALAKNDGPGPANRSRSAPSPPTPPQPLPDEKDSTHPDAPGTTFQAEIGIMRGRASTGRGAWGSWDGPERGRVRICCKGAPRRDRRREEARNINVLLRAFRLDPGLCNRFGQPAPSQSPGGAPRAGWRPRRAL